LLEKVTVTGDRAVRAKVFPPVRQVLCLSDTAFFDTLDFPEYLFPFASGATDMHWYWEAARHQSTNSRTGPNQLDRLGKIGTAARFVSNPQAPDSV
jgi:hypothetical protein